MKGFKIKTPKYIEAWEKKNNIVSYQWESIRDKNGNIVSSKRKYGIAEAGEKFEVPENKAVEKAIYDAKKAIRVFAKLKNNIQKVKPEDYEEYIKKMAKAEKDAREAILFVETAEKTKK